MLNHQIVSSLFKAIKDCIRKTKLKKVSQHFNVYWLSVIFTLDNDVRNIEMSSSILKFDFKCWII